MSRLKSLLIARVDWRDSRRFGTFLAVLVGAAMLVTAVGYSVQAALGVRDWASVPSTFLATALGSAVGTFAVWGVSVLVLRRRRRTER